MGECKGAPTFNEIYSGAFSEWPAKIPGFICKTPPFGFRSAPRFAQCCSGKVFNITAPTTPDDPAYPMSCATFCQVDQALAEDTGVDKYPYGFDDHFMCLTDGLEIPTDWEVVCATNSIAGMPAPTTFPSTPTGAWMTKDYSSYCEENYPACGNPLTETEFGQGGDAEITETGSVGEAAETTSSTSQDATLITAKGTDQDAATAASTTIATEGGAMLPTRIAGIGFIGTILLAYVLAGVS